MKKKEKIPKKKKNQEDNLGLNKVVVNKWKQWNELTKEDLDVILPPKTTKSMFREGKNDIYNQCLDDILKYVNNHDNHIMQTGREQWSSSVYIVLDRNDLLRELELMRK